MCWPHSAPPALNRSVTCAAATYRLFGHALSSCAASFASTRMDTAEEELGPIWLRNPYSIVRFVIVQNVPTFFSEFSGVCRNVSDRKAKHNIANYLQLLIVYFLLFSFFNGSISYFRICIVFRDSFQASAREKESAEFQKFSQVSVLIVKIQMKF